MRVLWIATVAVSLSLLSKTTVAFTPAAATVTPTATEATTTTTVHGSLRKWHKITLAVTGVDASETAHEGEDGAFNPFTDIRLDVTFVHNNNTYEHVPASMRVMPKLVPRRETNGMSISDRTTLVCGRIRHGTSKVHRTWRP